MRQLIIVRKDLNMSIGKITAQCCHASLAWLMSQIERHSYRDIANNYGEHSVYEMKTLFDRPYDDDKPRPQLYKNPVLQEMRDKAERLGLKTFYTKVTYSDDGNLPKIEWIDKNGLEYEYVVKFKLPQDIYENWIEDIFTKTVCEAKNKGHLLKAVLLAEELGLKENEDFFLIRDRCLTELEPEEVDENGIGSTLTCIGFRPLDDDTAHKISKKFQLLK